MEQWHLAEARISRVVEWLGPIGTVNALFPTIVQDEWTERADALAPVFWDPESNAFRAAIQTWIVEVDGLTVVVDTGVGNDRDRPQVPPLSHLETSFEEAFSRTGIAPDDVDIVINTHVHYDHVGWNTHRVNGKWVPLFRNARYLVPEKDVTYFDPANAVRMRAPKNEDEDRRFRGMRLVFEDSISPIRTSGQLETWDRQLSISEHLRLESAPGHTPGSSVLWLDSETSGGRAVFVGDLAHSPMQFSHPDDACAFDLDPVQARISRRHIFSRAAASDAFVVPAHFAGHGASTISLSGGAFETNTWSALSSI